jgi:hypothetical protein
MPANPDFKGLFSAFNDEGVEYLVAGAHAVIYFSEPRYTKDLDVWVRPSADNASRVYRALARFGAPLEGVSEADFRDADLVYQIGIEPNRIDVIMSVAGVGFDAAWSDRVESSYGGVPIHIMGRKSLIKAKRASGRPQDLLDLDKLESADGPRATSPTLPATIRRPQVR